MVISLVISFIDQDWNPNKIFFAQDYVQIGFWPYNKNHGINRI